MVFVAELARLAGRLDDAVADRHRDRARPGRAADRLATARRSTTCAPRMAVDKKSRGSQLRFVVLDGLASPRILAGPDEAHLRAAYDVMAEGAAMRVLVLNGPNLGRLGRRQPEIYGTHHLRRAGRPVRRTGAATWGSRSRCARPTTRASCSTGSTPPPTTQTPVVLNAGAWTHYSYALYDACAQLTAPLVEVHISDPSQRPEEFRHHSVVTPYAATVIAGQGVDGYRQALELPGGALTVRSLPRASEGYRTGLRTTRARPRRRVEPPGFREVDVDVGSSRAGDSVALRAQVDPHPRSLSGRARAARGDLEKALALAADLGGELPDPPQDTPSGSGSLWPPSARPT